MMTNNLKYILPVVIVFLTACEHNQKMDDPKQQNTLIFPQGDKNTTDNFKGEVWVKPLIDADSLNETAVGNVTFEPGARSKWHTHPAGQILLVTEGLGYYQERGKPKQILHKGDAVKCPPGVPHWHGASVDTAFVQVAITGRENGPTVWLADVTDEEYNK